MQCNTVIVVQLLSLMLLQQIHLSICANLGSSADLESILIVGGIVALCFIISICITSFGIAVLIIKLTTKEVEEDRNSEDQDNTVFTNTQLIEPTLNYDDVVNMDSLPPYIPGYTYNANIVNTNNSTLLSTEGEYVTLIQVPPAINTQEVIGSTEIYAYMSSPPPYLAIS